MLQNENTDLTDEINLKKAKQYFNKMKQYNKKLREIGYNVSDQASCICLFKDYSHDPIDVLTEF